MIRGGGIQRKTKDNSEMIIRKNAILGIIQFTNDLRFGKMKINS